MEKWKLEITGLVDKPLALSLAELAGSAEDRIHRDPRMFRQWGRAKIPRGRGQRAWTGTPLAPLLKEAGVQAAGIEVVFFSADHGKEKIRDGEYPQSFARSLSLADAMSEHVMLAYAMNGEPLTAAHRAGAIDCARLVRRGLGQMAQQY